MNPLAHTLIWLLDIYMWIIIATVVISWLVAFDVLNTKNKQVYKICDALNKITNPVINKIRQYVNPIGGIDISPIVAIIGISILQWIIVAIFY